MGDMCLFQNSLILSRLLTLCPCNPEKLVLLGGRIEIHSAVGCGPDRLWNQLHHVWRGEEECVHIPDRPLRPALQENERTGHARNTHLPLAHTRSTLRRIPFRI